MSVAPTRRGGRSVLTGRNTVDIGVDLSGLDDLLQEWGDAVEGATRPAAQAAAQVLYDRVEVNVAAIGYVTGNLRQSIYQAFSATHSSDGIATYHISWNHKEAPHGHLLENGHWQRYAVRITEDGWRTLVRPEKQGTKKPGRRASQAVKDGYYVPRPGGPVYIPGKAFLRRASVVAPQATHAAREVLLAAIAEVSNG